MKSAPFIRQHRQFNEIRPLSFHLEPNSHAEGYCMVKLGNTHVICTASLEAKVPAFLKGSGKGWISAEYGMLPRSTHSRMDRKRTHDSGRSQEISRLIGRSLRAITHLPLMGERQILIDCDVIRADGGTRTAAITGAFVALVQAAEHMLRLGMITQPIFSDFLAAISCGKVQGQLCCDLDYAEDSNADLDANFVMSGQGNLIEVQASAEGAIFNQDELQQMMGMANHAIHHMVKAQQQILQACPLDKLIAPCQHP